MPEQKEDEERKEQDEVAVTRRVDIKQYDDLVAEDEQFPAE